MECGPKCRLSSPRKNGGKEIAEVDPHFAGLLKIESVFHIDEGGKPSFALGLGNASECQRSFPGGFVSVDFGDPAPGNSSHPENVIEELSARGNGFDIEGRTFNSLSRHFLISCSASESRSLASASPKVPLGKGSTGTGFPEFLEFVSTVF